MPYLFLVDWYVPKLSGCSMLDHKASQDRLCGQLACRHDCPNPWIMRSYSRIYDETLRYGSLMSFLSKLYISHRDLDEISFLQPSPNVRSRPFSTSNFPVTLARQLRASIALKSQDACHHYQTLRPLNLACCKYCPRTRRHGYQQPF